ncbi:MAG TPA: GGDEF domain-containing phosphodiesterase, partial [Paraburkholderia sp.]
AFGTSTVLTERRRLEKQLISRTAAAQRARAAAEAAEQRVTHMAQHDPETGLPSRAGLALATAEMLNLRGGRDVYVAALGVDRFAAIRTAIGTQQAATLMHLAAQRLENKLRRARVGRLSADTLGVVLRSRDADEARAQIETALDSFAEPLPIGASRVDISLITGIAGAPEHAADAESLIECAQVALDQARLTARHFAIYDAGAERVASGGLDLLSALRAGLEDGAVWLAHQPKLNLRTGAWASTECLMRWTHRERGSMAPDSFIPLLEETGRISAVTDWVLERALREQQMLAEAGSLFDVAVNISARSLGETGLAARLTAILVQCGADASRVTLEITETALMGHAEIALANLNALRDAGFQISIDDYGAGMSSLSYLKRIPADELKIDSSFVRGMAQNQTDAVLVRSSIELAHSLGLRVVAEGVEDVETLALLREFGCDYAQGYHIARPMPVTRLLDLQREARQVA